MNEKTEFGVFESSMKKLLAVPKAELLRREAAYKEHADKNPRKRGPKKKVKV